jgi:hypothetical protein
MPIVNPKLNEIDPQAEPDYFKMNNFFAPVESDADEDVADGDVADGDEEVFDKAGF